MGVFVSAKRYTLVGLINLASKSGHMLATLDKSEKVAGRLRLVCTKCGCIGVAVKNDRHIDHSWQIESTTDGNIFTVECH